MDFDTMNLKILLPHEVLLHVPARKVIAEAANGSFCLLPNHVDFTAGLVPGILSYEDADGAERFVGVDEGVLVKNGADVLVSTRRAVRGPRLGTLREQVTERFEQIDDRERRARTAVSRLEANLVRRFMELERHGG